MRTLYLAVMESRTCPECGDPFRGRADKKFCSDQCRNAWHNRENRIENNLVRNTINALRRNRKILNDLCKEDKVVLKKSVLNNQGFDWTYHTETRPTREGKLYKFVFDLGYLELGDEKVLIVRNKE